METPERNKYEPSHYTIDVELPSEPGSSVEADVVTRERPFALTQLMHCVVEEDGNDPEQYSIDLSVQNEKRYWKGASAPMAKAAFGSVKTGRWIPFATPIPVEAKTSLFIRVTNRYATATGTRKIQIILHGVERVLK